MLHRRMSLNCQGAKSAAPRNYALVTRFAESRKAFEDFEVSTQQELKAGVAHWIGVKLLVAAGCETVNPSQTEPS